MALLWADGFDHYGNNNTLHLQGVYGVDWYLDNANQRTGGFCLGNNAFFNPTIVLPKAIPEGFLGYAFKCDQLGGDKRFTFRNNGNPQFGWKVNNDGSLQVMYGEGGATIWQSNPNLIQVNAWAYLEWYWRSDAVQGVLELRMNGAVLFVAPNINTGAPIDSLIFRVNGGNIWLDDYAVFDPTGTINNGFSGDIRCRTIFPEANGLNQDWTPVGQPQGFQCVNQVPPLIGTDYIEATAAGELSTFDMSAVPSNTGAIYGVMMFVNMNKADAGPCAVTAGVGSQGATDLSEPVYPGTGATYYARAIQADPKTGDAWDKDGVNGMQAIVERVL